MNDKNTAIGAATGALVADALWLLDHIAYRRGVIGVDSSDTITWLMAAAEIVLAVGLFWRLRGFFMAALVWCALRCLLHAWQLIALVTFDLNKAVEMGVSWLFYVTSTGLLLLFGYLVFALHRSNRHAVTR